MLVLARKKNDSVVIADMVEVVVCEIRGDKVRLGFIAPNDIPVHRKEIWVQLNPGKESPWKNPKGSN